MRWAVVAVAVGVVALLLLATPAPTASGTTSAPSPAARAGAPVSALSPAAPDLAVAPGLYPLGVIPGGGLSGSAASRIAADASLGRASAGAITPSSDLANPTLGTLSYGTSVAAVGTSNDSILVGTANETYLLTGSGLLWTYGLSAAIRTSDGGVTWSTSWVGPNASWTDPSNPAWGDITWGATSVAGDAGTALYATTYASPCTVLYPNGACANSSLGPAAPSGVAVARSGNGGASWSAPVPVDSVAEWQFVSGTCPGATGPYAGYIPGNITDQPEVAIAPDGAVAVVGWDDLDIYDSVVCIGGQAYESINAEYDLSEVAVSTNRGISWGLPVTIGAGASGPVAVAIGASPADTIVVTYTDLQNGTSATFPYALVQSTDDGASWTHPTDLGSPTMVHPVVTSAPDAFVVATLPELAADDNATSPYAGALYLAWADNRTSVDGHPSIALVSGTVHGGWSSVRYATPAGGTEEYFDPSIAVAPSGRVWLVYYAESELTGGYQLVGSFSDTEGLTWSSPFAIADGASYPTASDAYLGYTTGAAATASGLYSAWTDCRTAACTQTGAADVEAARTVPLAVTSSVAGPILTVRSAGYSVAAPTPFATALDANAAVTVQASAWTPLANSTEYVGIFANYTGAVISAANPVSFDFGGGSTIEANYLFTLASWIAGSVTPAAAAPDVTLDGLPVVLTNGSAAALAFNVSVEPGLVYALNVSAWGYQAQSMLLPAETGVTTFVGLSLVRDPGWILGRLEPSAATLTVDGAVVPAAPSTHLFNATVLWGGHWVNASAPGLTSFSEFVGVPPGGSTTVDITLDGAWIAGSVDPLNAAVTLDGVAVPVGTGAFNVSTVGGTQYLNATAPGYAPYHRVLSLTAGTGVYVAISLNDRGWIQGTVRPITALVAVQGSTVPIVDGAFNVSEVAGSVYNVSVEQTGFTTQWADVLVGPSSTHFENFTLVSPRSSCATDCASTNGSGTTSAGANPPYSWTDAAIAAGLILGVAVIVAAVVVLGGPPRTALRPREPQPGDPRTPSAPGSSPPPGRGQP